jgi:ABC-type multidrug transport system fused ATPase/permease subunit
VTSIAGGALNKVPVGQFLPLVAMIGGTWSFLRPRQRAAAALIAVASVASSAFELFALSTTVPFISHLMNPADLSRFPFVRDFLGWSGASPGLGGAIALGAAVVVCLALAFVCRLGTNWLVELFSLRLTNGLVRDVLGRTMAAPYGWLKQQNGAGLSQRVTTDATVVGQSTYPTALEILYSISLLALGTGVVVATAPWQALLALGALGLVSWSVMGGLGPSVARYSAYLREQVVESSRIAFEIFTNVKAIKAATAERYFASRYDVVFRDGNLSRMRVTLLSKAIPMLTLLFGQVGLIVVAVAMLASGLSPDELAARLTLIVVVLSRMLPTTAGLSGSISKLVKALPHYAGLKQVLGEIEAARLGQRGAALVPRNWGSLGFDDVAFRYPDSDADQLAGVSLTLRRGRKYGVVGPSGAGKSTFVDLLLGLMQPTAGGVQLDAVPLSDIGLGDWLGRIGYVGQEAPIMDDSVRRNVSFGAADEAVDDAKIWRALELAGVRADIEALPDGLDTRLGAGGSRLSGGQKQRVAMARALFRDIDILLLDEATSGLDPATEAIVLANLQKLPAGLTLVMVTHRLATTSFCDEVFVFDAGRLAARGAYESLMADERIYSLLLGRPVDSAA